MDSALLDAMQKGLSAPLAKGFMPYNVENGQIRPDFTKTSHLLAQDAALSTVPNVGAPAVLYSYLDPRIVEVLFSVKAAGKFFAPTLIGKFTDEYANFMVEEIAGQVSPYSDYADGTASDANYNFPVRQNFRFQTSIKYGDLETAKMSEAKVQLVARKQYAAAEIISRAENRFQLFGVAGLQSYGMLNDPNLPTTIAPISVNEKSTWADKTAANPDKVANIVFNDVNKLWAELTANNGGHLDVNSPIILGVSNKMISYLTTPNQFGKTAKVMLQENYPNITIEQLPELSTSSGEMLYMVVPEVMGDATGFGAFSAKAVFGRVIPETSSFKQKVSAGTWGCVIRHPSLVATMTGI